MGRGSGARPAGMLVAPGGVAQLVEHATENRGVAGSSPALATHSLARIRKSLGRKREGPSSYGLWARSRRPAGADRGAGRRYGSHIWPCERRTGAGPAGRRGCARRSRTRARRPASVTTASASIAAPTVREVAIADASSQHRRDGCRAGDPPGTGRCRRRATGGAPPERSPCLERGRPRPMEQEGGRDSPRRRRGRRPRRGDRLRGQRAAMSSSCQLVLLLPLGLVFRSADAAALTPPARALATRPPVAHVAVG